MPEVIGVDVGGTKVLALQLQARPLDDGSLAAARLVGRGCPNRRVEREVGDLLGLGAANVASTLRFAFRTGAFAGRSPRLPLPRKVELLDVEGWQHVPAVSTCPMAGRAFSELADVPGPY